MNNETITSNSLQTSFLLHSDGFSEYLAIPELFQNC